MARDRSSAPRQVTPTSFRRFTLAALAAQVAIVLTGAAVRLTGSGLGCSDWPNCEEDRLVASFEFHSMIEFFNRMVSFAVVATVVLVVWGALRRDPYRRDLVDLGIWIGILTGVQIVLGGITVITELSPPVVMAHFLLSMVLIALAVVLHHRATAATRGAGGPGAAVPPSRPLQALVGAAAAVLVTGTVVTGSGPHGGDETVERLGFYVPTVTRVHTATVFVFLAVLVFVLVASKRVRSDPVVLRAGTTVLAAAIAQGAIGYYQYFNGVPELAVFLHVCGAMLVWGTALWFVLEHQRASMPRRTIVLEPTP